MTDEALIQRFQTGDMQAFDALYERYRDDAYRTAYLITGTRADAEDLTQEAFVQCIQSLGSLRDSTKFRPWLLRLLSRNAWKYCKKRGREQPVSEVLQTGESESALSAVLRSEEQQQIISALYRLDERQRTAVVLYYFNGLSIHEVARATGSFEGTVKSRLHAARRVLRRTLPTQEPFKEEAATHETI